MPERQNFFGRLKEKIPRPCGFCASFYSPSSKPDNDPDQNLRGLCNICSAEVLGSALYIKYQEEGREIGEVGVLFEPFYDSGREDVAVRFKRPNGKRSQIRFVDRNSIEQRHFGHEVKQTYIRAKLILVEGEGVLVKISNSFFADNDGETILLSKKQLLYL